MHLASHSPHVHQLTSLSHAVTVTCDYVWHNHSVTIVTFLWLCDYHVIFPILHLSNNLKEKKRNINIDLVILPSHNTLSSKTTLLQREVRSISCRVLFFETKTRWSKSPSLFKQRYWPNKLFSTQSSEKVLRRSFPLVQVKDNPATLGSVVVIEACILAGILPKDRVCMAFIYPDFSCSDSTWTLK